MGVHPKIGITGLPRSGKSAVMEKVLDMLMDERKREISMRGGSTEDAIIGGVQPNPSLKTGSEWATKSSTLSPEKRASSLTRTSIPSPCPWLWN